MDIKILVVDDEQAIADIIKFNFEREGEKIGKITAHNVMKRPVTNVSKVISVHKVED